MNPAARCEKGCQVDNMQHVDENNENVCRYILHYQFQCITFQNLKRIRQ